MSLDGAIETYLLEVRQKGLLRTRDVAVVSKNRFDSNDYLSLSQEVALAQAYQQGFQNAPCGSGGSMLINGYHKAHKRVEEAFAQWLGVDKCVLFSSGFSANLAVTALLGKLKASCLIDKAVHASLYDGLALSKVTFSRYNHLDLAHLAHQLKTNPSTNALITEGIFSMGGQKTPLSEVYSLCQAQKVSLLVDEAHSIGVIGHEGKGTVEAHGLTQLEVPLRVIPLGKAFAAQGAIVAGQERWITGLLQAGRSLIYSTAVSPALAEGLLKSLELVAAADDRRAKLTSLISHFNVSIRHSPLQWGHSMTPIQQLQLGCPNLALYYADALKKQGIFCAAIRQPTVTKKDSGLRIVLNYNHEPEQITQLLETIHRIYEHTPH